MKGILHKLTQKQELNQDEIDHVVFGVKQDRFSGLIDLTKTEVGA